MYIKIWDYHTIMNVTFKIINKLKLNNDYFKFDCDFKSHVIFRMTLKKL
jgi:stringent starvation protein B